jgi:hypothetical protein
MSFRKEKKYSFLLKDFNKVKSYFINNGFKEIYQKREINSCYFDNKSFSMFHESEEGVLPRKKIRIRWYDGKIFNKETKVSSIEGRYKITQKLKNIKNINPLLKTKFSDRLYGHLYPVLIVNYLRQYYKFKDMRVTLDKNINYYRPQNKFVQKYKDKYCVVEVKTPVDFSDDELEKVMYLTTNRFSKYTRGITITKGINSEPNI